MSGRAPAATIRAAHIEDLPRLTEIYNHYVVHTPVTFDLEPFSIDQRREWFARFHDAGRHRLFVAEINAAVAGYAGSYQFRPKAAYDTTVETTIYLAPESTGRGIGAALYEHLFAVIGGEDLHMAVAGITLPNDASVALHARFGFVTAGMMHGVGRKFGQYWDVGWYEREL